MAKLGRKPWEPTKAQLATIERMAKAGMTIKMISYAVDVSPRTIHRHEKAHTTYRKGRAAAVTKIGKVALDRIKSGEADTALICFMLKTLGGFKEKETFVVLEDFVEEDGEKAISTEDKLKKIDREFAKGALSVSNYKLLCDSLTNRIKIDLMLEDIVKSLSEIQKLAEKVS